MECLRLRSHGLTPVQFRPSSVCSRAQATRMRTSCPDHPHCRDSLLVIICPEPECCRSVLLSRCSGGSGIWLTCTILPAFLDISGRTPCSHGHRGQSVLLDWPIGAQSLITHRAHGRHLSLIVSSGDSRSVIVGISDSPLRQSTPDTERMLSC